MNGAPAEVVHDYRPDQLRWGWAGLSFIVNPDRKTALMTGIGKGIKAGDYLVLQQAGADYAYLVEQITYDTNPTDFYNAYLRIAGTFE